MEYQTVEILSHFCRMNHYIAHEASFYLLKAVGSQGRLSSILGSEEQSMFLRLCCTVLPLSFFVEKLKKHLSNYPSLYMYSKSRSFTLVPSRGGGLECSVFPGNFILKTYFLKLKGPIKSSSAGAQSSKRIQAEISG